MLRINVAASASRERDADRLGLPSSYGISDTAPQHLSLLPHSHWECLGAYRGSCIVGHPVGIWGIPLFQENSWDTLDIIADNGKIVLDT